MRFVFWGISILHVLCLGSCVSSSPEEYPLHFHRGATGDNMSVTIGNTTYWFTVQDFAHDSNHFAVTALANLKWNILYPNSDGKIILVGGFDAEKSEIRLDHWYLMHPFKRLEVRDIESLPHEFVESEKLVFDASDFQIPLGVDPSVFNRKSPSDYLN